MRKINLFKSGFGEKLKLLLIPIGLLIGSSTMQVWAYNLEAGYLKYSFNGTESTYTVNDNNNYTLDKGTLTGSFDLKGMYLKSSTGSGDNWTGGHMGYTIYHNGSETSESTIVPDTHRGYGYNGNASSERQDEWEGTINIASSTSNSGVYYFKFYFVSYFGYGNDVYKPSYGNHKEIKYTILPPDVSDFTITPSGILSGSGTSDDPYILPHGGTLSVTLSGASQAHSDANSSAEYSVNGGSTWGTSSTYTTKSFSNITDTDLHDYVFKARYNNSDESLTGTEKSKTIYYKTSPWSIAGTMNSTGWDINTYLIHHYSSGTGYVDIDLPANTDILFKVKDRAGNSWYGNNGTMNYEDNNNQAWYFETDKGNCTITTAGAGTYRFTWNSGTKYLTVTYPTSYTVTFGYGTHGSSVTASGSTSGSIISGKYVARGENVTFTQTPETGYKLKGWYTASSGGTAVSTMSSSDNVLNSIAANANVYAQYVGNDFTVRFNANYPSGAVNNGASMDDQAFVYATAQNLSANAFACEGYTFTGWKKDNATSGDDVTAGSDGSTLTTTDGATVNLYAQWADDGTYYYKGASASGWATAANWTRNAVPGSTDDVIVLTALNAPSGTTTVKSVRIATSGTYTVADGTEIEANGSLTIPGSAALKVVTNVANCTINANAPTSGTSTTSSTLNIGYGGALVWGTAGTPGDATVGFYTPSGGVPGSKDAINDYIGIPFTSLSSDAYSNAWVFAVSGDTWAEISGATLSPWTGYNIIEKLEDGDPAGGSYSLTGTLVANNATVSGGATAGTETLYANSWVAPIEISKMSITGTATVYLFRPTSFNKINDVDDPLGNYDVYPVNSSSGEYIPSMKSFSVVSSTASVNYATAVYGEVSGAFSAPRRERKADYRQAIWDTQDSLFVNVKAASGWGDVLKMFIHEDFSQNYENGWDGPKMEGMWEAPKLYTLNNEGEMAVSCVPTAENSVIAFHAGTASNEYTFTFKYSGDDELVLKDTKTGIETPIVNGGTYEFTSNTSDDDMRFVIKKVSNAATGVENIYDNVSGVQKVMHNGTIYIIRDGRIYTTTGNVVK